MRNLTGSVIGVSPGTGKITLMGAIDANMAAEFKKALAADSHIDTLLIDSYGGQNDSAMDIADLLRQRKMHMVVDGRCLSACAIFLFPAAASKTVLPGSVVAIHGSLVIYRDDDKLKLLTASQMDDLFRSSATAKGRESFELGRAREAEFRRQLGLNNHLNEAFARYLAHRKQLLGTDLITAQQHAPGCPPVQMWALDKAQLEAAGVRGIGAFWTPSGDEQKSQLLRDLGLPEDFLYYGPAAGLEQLCNPAPGWGATVRHWLERARSAVTSAFKR